MYTAALAAGIALFGDTKWVEPAMLATTVAAAVYGLSERLVPWLVDLEDLISANDRLAQPLTYWNAQGAMAALGLTLAAGLAAEDRFARWAAACAPVLGLDLYLTLSRGAIGAGAGRAGAGHRHLPHPARRPRLRRGRRRGRRSRRSRRSC